MNLNFLEILLTAVDQLLIVKSKFLVCSVKGVLTNYYVFPWRKFNICSEVTKEIRDYLVFERFAKVYCTFFMIKKRKFSCARKNVLYNAYFQL